MSSEPRVGSKRDFIGRPAPPGYVAGVGRGATGFTTRSDIGPAREAALPIAAGEATDSTGPSTSRNNSATQTSKQRSGAVGGGPSTSRSNNEADEEEYLNDNNYDEFAGYGGSLFNKDPYEEDDEEADKIYEEIDKHLDERGKALREAKTRLELEEYRTKRPKIQQQFTDLKATLKTISEEDWMAIPDVGDARNRKQRVARQDKFTPVPDSLLAHQAKLANGGERLVYIEPNAMEVEYGDHIDESDTEQEAADGGEDSKVVDKKPFATLDGGGGRKLNIGEMSEFRSSYMSMKLSRISSSTTDKSQETEATNPQDYLTNLQSMVPNQITDTATLKEYRKQFASLRSTNPTFQNAWIASVRLEEAAGNLKRARNLIMEACEKCPKSADLWLEAVRLQPPDVSKAIMVRALRENPRSVKLWIHAADLEADETGKRAVYAKARQIVPKSVLIWKRSVELEQPEQARIILRSAVECCPEAVELWLALAKLLPYEEAKQVLVSASERNPSDRSIWITAAKLEEQKGDHALAKSIVRHAIEELSKKGVEIKRADWLREAVDADRAQFKVTCKEIIRRIIGWNIAEEERLKTWLEDAKRFSADNSINCARAVFIATTEVEVFGRMESVWLEYADFERTYGTSESLVEMLKLSVEQKHCIKSEKLWLMLADELQSQLDECRHILSEALEANPDSEKIVLAAVELECANGNHKEARRILADACMSAKTAQLVMRAARLEWSLGNIDEAVRQLKAGVEEYKDRAEFYLLLGQIEEERGVSEQAKSWYSNGLKFNPTSVQLWISMARLEERTGNLAKARARLERARVRNPRNALLWLEAAQLELRAFTSKRQGASSNQRGSRPDMVTTVLAKGIRECRDQEHVDKLLEMQEDVNKRKFT